MTTRIESKKTIAKWCLIGILFIVAWVLISAPQASAKTVKFRVVHYVVKVEASPVGDVEGHVIGYF